MLKDDLPPSGVAHTQLGVALDPGRRRCVRTGRPRSTSASRPRRRSPHPPTSFRTRCRLARREGPEAFAQAAGTLLAGPIGTGRRRASRAAAVPVHRGRLGRLRPRGAARSTGSRRPSRKPSRTSTPDPTSRRTSPSRAAAYLVRAPTATKRAHDQGAERGAARSIGGARVSVSGGPGTAPGDLRRGVPRPRAARRPAWSRSTSPPAPAPATRTTGVGPGHEALAPQPTDQWHDHEDAHRRTTGSSTAAPRGTHALLRSGGFTVVELVVSMALIGIVFGIFSVTMSATNRTSHPGAGRLRPAGRGARDRRRDRQGPAPGVHRQRQPRHWRPCPRRRSSSSRPTAGRCSTCAASRTSSSTGKLQRSTTEHRHRRLSVGLAGL